MGLNGVYNILETVGLARLMAVRIPHNQLTVLSLHRVADDDDFFWQPLRVKQFEQLLQFCVKNFEIVSFADLWQNKSFTKPPLVLSFDDGYLDFIDTVLPMLVKHGIPCNHNIVTECTNGARVIWTQKMNIIFNHLRNNRITCVLHLNDEAIQVAGAQTNWQALYNKVYHTFLNTRLNRDEILDQWAAQVGVTSFAAYPVMNWEQLRQCAANGVEIGSHTRTHPVLALCTEEELTAELVGSKKEIEEKIGAPCHTIAFPNGNYNEHTVKACQAAGYKNILIVNDRRYVISNTGQSKVIDRINMYGSGYSELALRVVGFNKMVSNALSYVRH